MNKKILFSDIDLSFAKNPATNDIYLLQNEAAIARSFKNLLTENFYERLFRPEIGTQIFSLLFENNSDVLDDFLKDVIELTILNFESRIEIKDIKISHENHALYITIDYVIVGFQNIYSSTIFLKKTK